MTVYCNVGFSQDIKERNYYVANFLSGMVYHFQNLTFGEGVKQIAQFIFCGPKDFTIHYGTGMSYGRRNKGLSNIFPISYEAVKELEGKNLLLYVSDELLKETVNFESIMPKQFDLNTYKESLNDYLKEALQIVVAGGNPSNGKILNEDIQKANLKKYARL